ncbi:hypothetical protein [Enterobacter sp.]|uniref:hypothetical protein n=1 Tax=Enterobacter sp. TaxID=42895 RepID=UPI00298233B8|nr:hypothetical protein [Enterobacter sp.]
MSDNTVCCDLFDNAINQIELYQHQVEAKSTELPQRETIGIACFWLLFLSNEDLCEKYWMTVIKLMDLTRCISMYQLLSEVIELAIHAEDLIEKSINEQEMLNNSECELF